MKLGELMSQLINIMEDEGTAQLPVIVAIDIDDCPVDKVHVVEAPGGNKVLVIEGQT